MPRQGHARNGMMAMEPTPVLPEAVPVGAFPAQLRRPRSRAGVTAQRRLQPAGERAKVRVVPRRLASA